MIRKREIGRRGDSLHVARQTVFSLRSPASRWLGLNMMIRNAHFLAMARKTFARVKGIVITARVLMRIVARETG